MMPSKTSNSRGVRLPVEVWERVEAEVKRIAESTDPEDIRRRGKSGEYKWGDYVREAVIKRLNEDTRKREYSAKRAEERKAKRAHKQ